MSAGEDSQGNSPAGPCPREPKLLYGETHVHSAHLTRSLVVSCPHLSSRDIGSYIRGLRPTNNSLGNHRHGLVAVGRPRWFRSRVQISYQGRGLSGTSRLRGDVAVSSGQGYETRLSVPLLSTRDRLSQSEHKGERRSGSRGEAQENAKDHNRAPGNAPQPQRPLNPDTTQGRRSCHEGVRRRGFLGMSTINIRPTMKPPM